MPTAEHIKFHKNTINGATVIISRASFTRSSFNCIPLIYSSIENKNPLIRALAIDNQ